MTDNIDVPMSDSDIKKYFPNNKIYKYNELAQFNNIDQLLPKNKDGVFILYQDSPNSGHWCLVTKYNDHIEMFDSYGQKNIDDELLWISKDERRKLKTNKPHLTRLLNNCPYKVIFNGFKYQQQDNDIMTCGRHCCMRLLALLKGGINLQDYHKGMNKLKNKSKMTFDEIVSNIIK